jgi:hypothetical protein
VSLPDSAGVVVLGNRRNAPLTWSVWNKPATLQPSAVIYSRRDAATSSGFVIGLDNGVPFVEVINAGAVQRASASTAVAQGRGINSQSSPAMDRSRSTSTARPARRWQQGCQPLIRLP